MTKVERYNWNEVADMPSIRMVPVSKLRVDHSYQRANFTERTVLSIAGGFDWSKFGALSVMLRNGQMYVTDGQNRLEAVRRRGDIASVPCVVTESDGVASEAIAFIGANTNRKPITSYDRYRANLCANDPLHVALDAMVKRIGFHIDQNGGADHIAWPTLLVRTFAASPELTEKCLVLQRAAVGPKVALHNYAHKGLFYVAARQKSGNIFDHGAKMYAAGGMQAILHEIRRLALLDGRGGVSEKLAGTAILNIVNKNLKSHRVEV